MKFNLTINQKAIIENKFDLDVIDAIILDYLLSFVKSEAVLSIQEKNRKFYWFSHEKISSELPILQLKKDSIFRRMKSLSEKGFLIQSSQSQFLGRSFYAITEKTEKIKFISDQNQGYGSKSDTTDQNPKPTDRNPKVRKKIRSKENDPKPTDQNPTNNNNQDNNELFSEENNSKKDVYPEAVKLYFDFYEELNSVKPKFDAADGKSLKVIISYLKSLHKDKKDGSDQNEYILKNLKYIFDNWHKQVDFVRNQTKMTQINSNLNNIINKLKNGKSKPTSEGGRNQGNKIVGKSRQFTIEDFVKDSENPT